VAVVWHLWKERNGRIFQMTENSRNEVLKRISEDVHILMSTCTWDSEGTDRELRIIGNWDLTSD